MQLSPKLKSGFIFIVGGIVTTIISDIYEQTKPFFGETIMSLTITFIISILVISLGIGLVLIAIFQQRGKPLNTVPKMSKSRKRNCDTNFYSPIHAMIVGLNHEVPRYKALNIPQGAYGFRVDASSIDVNKISTIISENMGKDGFTDTDCKMWIDIAEEIKRDNYFCISNERQKWFDELETKFV